MRARLRVPIVAALLTATAAMAQPAGGSWSRESYGGAISRGGQPVHGPWLQPARPPGVGAIASGIAWRITPAAPLPAGMEIRLCQRARCLLLPALSGELALPPGFSASEPYRFVYLMRPRGEIFPTIVLLSNRLTLRYRCPAPHSPARGADPARG